MARAKVGQGRFVGPIDDRALVPLLAKRAAMAMTDRFDERQDLAHGTAARLFALLTIATFFEGFDTRLVALVQPVIGHEFGASRAELGRVVGSRAWVWSSPSS